jgi:MtN3 and saliva related transmembrane protein
MQELLGFVGGAFMTLGFIPQVWRLFKLKSAREISLPFTILFLLGTACWLIYGILFGLAPVILWNAISLALGLAMLYAKLKYGSK